MARPVQANAEATRNRIIDEARTLFAERGFAETSTREIARHAGVSLGTLHHYFGSKDRLLTSCVDVMYKRLATLQADLQPHLVGEANVAAVLERAVRQSFRFACTHHLELRLLQRTIIARGLQDPNRLQNIFLPFLDATTTVLAPRTGLEAQTIRLNLQSLIHLIVRYGVTETVELKAVAGCSQAQARSVVEDHLVALAFANFQLAGVPR